MYHERAQKLRERELQILARRPIHRLPKGDRRSTTRLAWRASVVLTAGIAMLSLLLAFGCGDDDDGGETDEFAGVREAIAQYTTPEKAEADGWGLVDGLDNCFDNPGVGAMGVHYIDADRLDTTLDELKPEAIIYGTGTDGKNGLVGVEYIVPAEAWDDEEHGELPEVLGHTFHLNEELGVYVLHAWLFKDNPAGILQDWNPNVTCA